MLALGMLRRSHDQGCAAVDEPQGGFSIGVGTISLPMLYEAGYQVICFFVETLQVGAFQCFLCLLIYVSDKSRTFSETV